MQNKRRKPMENTARAAADNTTACSGRSVWVRFDTAVYQDYTVPPFYDSLIGKLIVHASTRRSHTQNARGAMQLVIEGIDHNGELHNDILSDKAFQSGDYTIDFLDKRLRR